MTHRHVVLFQHLKQREKNTISDHGVKQKTHSLARHKIGGRNWEFKCEIITTPDNIWTVVVNVCTRRVCLFADFTIIVNWNQNINLIYKNTVQRERKTVQYLISHTLRLVPIVMDVNIWNQGVINLNKKLEKTWLNGGKMV